MKPQTNEELLASKNSWAKLAKAFDNQRMTLHQVNSRAILILQEVKELDQVHPHLPALLEAMIKVQGSNPSKLPNALPSVLIGHGDLLDQLLQATYYCSQATIDVAETTFFQEALTSVKEALTYNVDPNDPNNQPLTG